MKCPKCGQWLIDYDGMGVLAHDECGYCSHPSSMGGMRRRNGMNSKQAMTQAFGDEIGGMLYTVTRRLSNTSGIDLDDVASEVMMTALDAQVRYGFVHVKTVAERVKNELYDTYKYGVNQYYGAGHCEISADAETEQGGTLLDTLAALGDSYRAVDVRLVVEQVTSTLDQMDYAIVRGLFAGQSPKEIATDLGVHWDSVYKHRRALRKRFAAALA